MKDINRLRLLPLRRERMRDYRASRGGRLKTSKWLSEQLGIISSTVSKWCINTSQPDMETLARISKLLA